MINGCNCLVVWLKSGVSGVPLHAQVSTSGFVTMEKAAEIEQFFKDNPCPVADRIVK